jgi:two-component system nitrogen regulation sensor histidine kinase NtrY
MTAAATSQGLDRLAKRVRLWARRVGLSRKFAFAVAIAAVLAGAATIFTITTSSPLGPDRRTILLLVYPDVIVLLLLVSVVTTRLVSLWVEHRKNAAGSNLHVRLVFLFSIVAVTPAIMVSVFSALYLNFAIQEWFNDRVRTAIEESRVVAHAYLDEHRQSIRADALAMANDINRAGPVMALNPRQFSQMLSAQAALRKLPEALVVDSDGKIVAQSQYYSVFFDSFSLPPAKLQEANSEGFALLASEQDDRVRAVVKLERFVDAYLVVGRPIEARITDHIDRTEYVANQYKNIDENREGIQITFVMIFGVVSLLLLLAAIWFALMVATRIARPVGNLIVAAERIGKGDLTARVASSASSDEIGTLSRAFNRMTSQLEGQQLGLIEANRQIDERRRFTETVLAGVSSGVVGLDREGRINLPNRSASDLLSMELDHLLNSPLAEIVPEMAPLIADAMARPDRLHQAEIQLHRKGVTHTFLVRIGAERLGDDIIGYVATFDDITELQTAQRKAAWADIARRIAHEIKNPLTPIQLSAERLKRKYLKEIQSDPATFATCTETIVRQVEDIGRMVDEFSSFARMPQPVMQPENAGDVCRQALFLESNRYPDIGFETDLPDRPVSLRCDARQIGRALTNLLKNAAESISERKPDDGGALSKGRIRLRLTEKEGADGRQVAIEVIDNGRGLPKEHRERLTEPYVTSREKGTGLGLAIVKKIMEEHGGTLSLGDAEGGGAVVTLTFRDAVQLPPAQVAANEENLESRILAHGS